MAQIEVPRLVTKRRGAKTYHYWNPSEPLRKAGWKAEALGQDEAAAMARCRLLNNRLDQWRAGGARPAAVKAIARQGTMAQLIAAYEAQAMPASANTAREYRTKLRIIADWAGHMPIARIDRAAVRDWRTVLLTPDRAGHVALHRATSAMRMLHTLMRFAIDAGMLPEGTPNPAAKQNMPSPPPRDQAWSDAATEIMVALAQEDGQGGLALAILLAREAAQREADWLHCTIDKWVIIPRHKLNADDWERLAEPGPDGMRDVRGLRVRQRKTRRWVEVPIVGETRRLMEQAIMLARLSCTTMLLLERRADGSVVPWAERQFQRAVADLRQRAQAIALNRGDAELAQEIGNLQFRDLRRTCVVWMGELGIEDHLIAAITGHTLDATRKILEVYLPRNTRMAGRAIALREARSETARADPDQICA